MAQQVYIGTNAAPQAGIYGGASPIDYEEGTTGANGFGVRMTASRVYHNWATQLFTGGSRELTQFNSGHLIYISISNLMSSGIDMKTHDGKTVSSATHHKVAAGNYDADLTAMFVRIAALGFDSNVTGGSTYGGKTQPNIKFIYEHEMDATGVDGAKGNYYYSNGYVPGGSGNGTKDTATDYVNALTHVHSLWVAAAAGAGVPTSRCVFNFCMTSYGYGVGRVAQYYPAAGIIGELGSDPYLSDGAGGGGTDKITDVATFAISKNLPVAYPEFNCQGLDSSTRATAFTNALNTLANETRYINTALMIWNSSDSANKYNFQKSATASANGGSSHAFPLTHAAIAAGITTCGGNPIISTVGQAVPTSPTGVSATSNSAGTTLTMTWAAPPGGDNVTGWDVYINPGTTTSLHKDNSSTLAATPRSYIFSGLTPGSPYSYTVVAINLVGRSGYGNIPTTSTTTPSVGSAPVITAASAVPQTANPLLVDVAATATDPGSLTLTYQWTFTNTTTGNVTNFTGASGTVTFANAGTHTFAVAVTNTIPKTTTQAGSFAINLGSLNTTNYQWPMPQAGQDVRTLAPQMRGWMPDLDSRVFAVSRALNNTNALHGLVASSFDPVSLSGATSATPASGNFIWTGMVLQGTSINGLVTMTTAAQIGTGVVIGFYDANGSMINQDDRVTPALYSGASVDAWLAGTASVQPVSMDLPSAITKRTFGEVIYVGIYFPTLSTYPALRVCAAVAYTGKLNVAAQPRFGIATGQTTAPDPLPFASWANSIQPFFIGIY